MKALVFPLLLAATGVIVAGPLSAQTAAEYCAQIYPSPQVGEYAELEINDPSQGSMDIRFAVVGLESMDEKDHYWMEVVTVLPATGMTVIVQMLVPGWPFQLSEISGYVIKVTGEPPQKLPLEMIQNQPGASPALGWEEVCKAAKSLGNERVTVAAGTFEAEHFRADGEYASEVWLSPNVPFGIVKFVQAEGSMELQKFGTGAKSSITEEPIEFEVPGRPPPDPA